MLPASELRDSGTCRSEITTTSTARGTLMKNIQCQEACSISHPPRTGPRAVVIVVSPAHVPIALPRVSSSKDELMIARLPGTRNAAATPWNERHSRRALMLSEKPQPAEATANATTPNKNIARRPTASPSAPPTRIRAERNNPYDSMTHCTSTTVAWRLDCRAGKATLTTVLSMNAMLEPRIVADRIHGRDFSRHGAAAPLRITASSHGCFIWNVDAYGFANGCRNGTSCKI